MVDSASPKIQTISPQLILQLVAGISFLTTLINLAYSSNALIDIFSSLPALLVKLAYIGTIISTVGLFLFKRWAAYTFMAMQLILIVVPATVGILQINSIIFKLILIGTVYTFQKFTN